MKFNPQDQSPSISTDDSHPEMGVITVASGKDLYFQMAATLARSFSVHHPESKIGFAIATDQPECVPEDVATLCRVVTIDSDLGNGFELKLHLDTYSPFHRTLFIDADCLITGSLQPIFDRWFNQDFAVVGCNAHDGEWFGDIAHRCEVIGLKELPVFVGATYYFESSEKAKGVFAEARNFAERYDDLGLNRLRGKINEEPLISIGMAIHGYTAELDRGDIKCDAMNFQGPIEVDVFAGESKFSEPIQGGLNSSQAAAMAFPVIAHFNDAFAKSWEYQRESHRLRLHFARGWPVGLARITSRICIELPGRFTRWSKDTFRPLYRTIFGVRSISKNERV